jgi:hypothetical protein
MVCIVTSFSDNSSSDGESGLSRDAQGIPVRVANGGHKRRHRRYRRHRTPTARLIPVLEELVHQLQDKVPTLVTVEDAAAVPTFITTPEDPSKSFPVMVNASTSTEPIVIRVTDRGQPLYFHATPQQITALIIPPKDVAEYYCLSDAREFVEIEMPDNFDI